MQFTRIAAMKVMNVSYEYKMLKERQQAYLCEQDMLSNLNRKKYFGAKRFTKKNHYRYKTRKVLENNPFHLKAMHFDIYRCMGYAKNDQIFYHPFLSENFMDAIKVRITKMLLNFSN